MGKRVYVYIVCIILLLTSVTYGAAAEMQNMMETTCILKTRQNPKDSLLIRQFL